ncbi:MAG TPA: hypothetical protein VF677_00900 [Flavobacterium sp.]|jgi:hypothetical protein
METVGDRFKQLIENETGTIKEFCNKYDFVYYSIQPILNNKREMGMNILKQLLECFPDLNLDWFLLGKGESRYNKKDDHTSPDTLREPAHLYGDDPFEKLFLAYLNKETVKSKITDIVKGIEK